MPPPARYLAFGALAALGVGLAWRFRNKSKKPKGNAAACTLTDFLTHQRDVVRSLRQHMLSSSSNAASSSSATDSKVHIVLGNEAADMDSMSSAIMLAYLLHHTNPAKGPYIPMINIAREELELRGEAFSVFERSGVDVSLVTFLDDLDLVQLHDAGRLSITLVDHNRLSPLQECLADDITAVVDHHVDEHLYRESQMAPRIIQPVGSCSSLVLSAFLSSDNSHLLNPDTSFLLLAPILLDTRNMCAEQKKGTPLDAQSLQFLSAMCQESDLAALTSHLLHLRSDITRLSTAQLLVKDAKFALVSDIICCVSTVPLSVADWIARDCALAQSWRTFCETKSLHLLVALTSYADEEGRHRRELAIFSPDPLLHQSFLLVFGNLSQSLDLESKHFPSLADSVSVFQLRDLTKSRKQVMPIVVSVLNMLQT